MTAPAGVAVLTTGVLVGDGVSPQARVAITNNETDSRIANVRSVMFLMFTAVE